MSFSIVEGDNTDVAVVYLRGTANRSLLNDPLPWRSFVAEDDEGVRWSMNVPTCGTEMIESNSMAYGLIFNAYPRRQRSFLVHLLNSRQDVLATFRVRNPKQGPYPTWTAQHLPLSDTNGPVTLTLKSLVRLRNPTDAPFLADWDIASTEPNWKNLEFDQFKFRDPTGNEASQPLPHEPVWKMKVRARRDRPTAFAAGEKMTFADIPVPTRTNFVSIDRSLDDGTAQIDLLLLAPPGELYVTNHFDRGFSPTIRGREGYFHEIRKEADSWYTLETRVTRAPILMFRALRVGVDEELWLKVIDERGREVISANLGEGSSRSMADFESNLDIPADSRYLTAVFWVSRPRYFSFLVNEADVLDETAVVAP